MTGYSSTASEKKSSDAADDLPIFNAENLQNNLKIIYYSRTFLSIIGGVIAGILGFTGLTGFIFYFLVMAITSLGLAAKARFSFHSYFESWNQILLDGFLSGLMSFVLFWTYPFHNFMVYAYSLISLPIVCLGQSFNMNAGRNLNPRVVAAAFSKIRLETRSSDRVDDFCP